MSAPGAVWRAEVALPLAALAIVYLVGWARLARRTPRRCRPRLMARLGFALGGVTAVAVALLGLHAAAHESFVSRFQHDPAGAKRLLATGEHPRDRGLVVPQHAAMTMTASLLLNLDETLSKE